MSKKPVKVQEEEEVSFLEWNLNYPAFPCKLVVVYKQGVGLQELFKRTLVSFPILHGMGSPPDSYRAFVYKPNESGKIFLFISDDVTLGVIAHECVHIIARIFEHIGSSFSDSSEEFFAYYLDYTFEEIIKACKEKFKIDIKL